MEELLNHTFEKYR